MATDYIPYIVICALILILIGAAYYLYRVRRKNYVNPKNIPQSVFDDFNRAEELAKQYNGTVTPQEILLQIRKEKEDAYKKLHNIKAQPMEQIQEEQPKIKPKINIGNLFRRKN